MGAVQVLDRLLLMADPAATGLAGVAKRIVGVLRPQCPVRRVAPGAAQALAQDGLLVQFIKSLVEQVARREVVVAVEAGNNHRHDRVGMRQVVLIKAGMAVPAVESLVRRPFKMGLRDIQGDFLSTTLHAHGRVVMAVQAGFARCLKRRQQCHQGTPGKPKQFPQAMSHFPSPRY